MSDPRRGEAADARTPGSASFFCEAPEFRSAVPFLFLVDDALRPFRGRRLSRRARDAFAFVQAPAEQGKDLRSSSLRGGARRERAAAARPRPRAVCAMSASRAAGAQAGRAPRRPPRDARRMGGKRVDQRRCVQRLRRQSAQREQRGGRDFVVAVGGGQAQVVPGAGGESGRFGLLAFQRRDTRGRGRDHSDESRDRFAGDGIERRARFFQEFESLTRGLGAPSSASAA